jgi:hypothetical protein
MTFYLTAGFYLYLPLLFIINYIAIRMAYRQLLYHRYTYIFRIGLATAALLAGLMLLGSRYFHLFGFNDQYTYIFHLKPSNPSLSVPDDEHIYLSHENYRYQITAVSDTLRVITRTPLRTAQFTFSDNALYTEKKEYNPIPGKLTPLYFTDIAPYYLFRRYSLKIYHPVDMVVTEAYLGDERIGSLYQNHADVTSISFESAEGLFQFRLKGSFNDEKVFTLSADQFINGSYVLSEQTFIKL